jgi:hypothetical protein
MELKSLSRCDAERSVSIFVADIQMIQELLRGHFSTGNSRPNHKDIFFSPGSPVGVFRLSSIAVVLLVDSVIFDQMFRILGELVIMLKFLGDRPAQLAARLLDDFHMTSLHGIRHLKSLQFQTQSQQAKTEREV